MITYSELAANYVNTAPHNDALHQALTEATWTDPLSAGHRRHVEQHQLGFGDPAFHAMWAVLLQEAALRFGTVRALEIGIYKGQVISWWALLGLMRKIPLRITGLGPLKGKPALRLRFLNRLLYRLSSSHREQMDTGNCYADEDYEAIVRNHFQQHGCDFGCVHMHRGYSTDTSILESMRDDRFEIIYVDGDHRYAGADHDFRTFGPKVVPGGWLVADDAGCDLPGTTFWKGYASVSKAVEILPSLGFRNVFNVGHNRVYERLP